MYLLMQSLKLKRWLMMAVNQKYFVIIQRWLDLEQVSTARTYSASATLF